MTKISEVANKRFSKDTKIPIQIFEENLFSYYLDLFNNHYDSKNKYSQFLSLVEKLNGEENFFNESRKIIDSIVSHIQKKESYVSFNNGDMNIYKNNLQNNEKLYQQKNIGKKFISIDLKKANFQAFQFVDSSIVDNCNSYQEFFNQFSNEEYFLNSKQIRQVIFGNLNPKRQQTVQKYLMSLIREYLIDNGVSEDFITSSTSDEIVIQFSDSFNIYEIMNNRNILENNEFHIELFTLNKAHDIKPFYMKSFENGKYELKGVPSYYVPQVLKHVEGLPIQEEDLYFIYEGELSKFVKSIYN